MLVKGTSATMSEHVLNWNDTKKISMAEMQKLAKFLCSIFCRVDGSSAGLASVLVIPRLPV